MWGIQRLLLPQRLPGHVLANLSLAPGLPHQGTKHRKYLLLLVFLLGGRARALPQRLHPAQIPFPVPGLLYVGLSHTWTPSSGNTGPNRKLAKHPLSLAVRVNPCMKHVMYHQSRKWPQHVGVSCVGLWPEAWRCEILGVLTT